MDGAQFDFNRCVIDLADSGWKIRDYFLKKNGITPQLVNLEDLLHGLEQHLAEFNEKFSNLSLK